jgi:hypothetical protein
MCSTKLKRICILALVVAMAIPGFAATSYNISLSGSVSATCSLTITTATAASSLPITTKVTNTTIATIVEKSNAASGYTVALSSANGWLLKGSSANLAYTLAYGGTAVDTSVAAGVSTTITSSTATTASAGSSKILAISFDGASSLLPSGDYSDTLTISIAAL